MGRSTEGVSMKRRRRERGWGGKRLPHPLPLLFIFWHTFAVFFPLHALESECRLCRPAQSLF